MPWTRGDDGAAFHRRVLAIPQADRATVWGLVHMCATYAAHQETDGWVPDTFVDFAAPPGDVKRLMAIAKKVGLVTGRARRGALGWGWAVVVDHEDQLLHNRSKAEVQRDRDRRSGFDAATQLRILSRDGDQCRYCGITVNPRDRKGGRARQFDHVDNNGPSSYENGAVACAACNGRKADGDALELRRPPPQDDLHLHPETRLRLEQAFPHLFPSARPTDGSPRDARPVDALRAPRDPDLDRDVTAHLAELDAASGSGTDLEPIRGTGPQVRRDGFGSGGAGPGRVEPGRRAPPRRGGRRHRPRGAA